jgi:hypothetical protein
MNDHPAFRERRGQLGQGNVGDFLHLSQDEIPVRFQLAPPVTALPPRRKITART